jgi:hypothetical protein
MTTATLGNIYAKRFIGTTLVLENTMGGTLTISPDPSSSVSTTLKFPSTTGNIGEVLTTIDTFGTTAWQPIPSDTTSLISAATLGASKSGFMIVKDGIVDDRKCRLTTANVKEGLTGLDIEDLNITTNTISNSTGDINISTIGSLTGKTLIQLGSNDVNTEFVIQSQDNTKLFSVDGAGTIYPPSSSTGNWLFTGDTAGIASNIDLIQLATSNVTVGSNLFTNTSDPSDLSPAIQDSDIIYTADVFMNGLIVRSGLTQNRIDTFPAAIFLVGNIGGVKVGTSFILRIVNSSSKNLTFSAGPGCTINHNGLIIGPNVTLTAHVRITNINSGTEAYTVQFLSRSGF